MSPDPPSPRDRRILALMAALAEMARVVRRKTEENDFDETNMRLLALAEEAAGARPSDLATALGLGPPSISRRVRQLEQAGLLEAESDPNDRRGYRIRCTEDGRLTLGAFREGLVGQFAPALDGWSDRDLDNLTALLQRLNRRIGPEATGSARQRANKNWWQRRAT